MSLGRGTLSRYAPAHVATLLTLTGLIVHTQFSGQLFVFHSYETPP